MRSDPLPPILRSVSVNWSQTEAFDRFTRDFGSWWPGKTHSIGGPRLRQIVFEGHAGGRIFEEHNDGRRFQWGVVEVWEPPARVKFTWHPSREESTAQDVELEFIPDGAGTRVELTASGWERWGEGAARARKGYSLGWAYVLNVYAEKRDTKMALMDVMASGMTFIQRFRGGQDALIAKSSGEMPRAEEG